MRKTTLVVTAALFIVALREQSSRHKEDVMRRRSFTLVFLILAGFFLSERADALPPAGEFLKVKLPADVDSLTVTLELTGFTPDSTSEYLITMVVRNVNTGQQAVAAARVTPGVDHAPLQGGTSGPGNWLLRAARHPVSQACV